MYCDIHAFQYQYNSEPLLSFLSISNYFFFVLGNRHTKYRASLVHLPLHLHHIFKSHVVNQTTTTLFIMFVHICMYQISELMTAYIKYIPKRECFVVAVCAVSVRGQLFKFWMFFNYKWNAWMEKSTQKHWLEKIMIHIDIYCCCCRCMWLTIHITWANIHKERVGGCVCVCVSCMGERVWCDDDDGIHFKSVFIHSDAFIVSVVVDNVWTLSFLLDLLPSLSFYLLCKYSKINFN